jgi:hypothetical protein
LGDDLKEVLIGVDAGRRLPAVSRNLVVQGRYSYAFVQKVAGISTNHSNVRGQVTYRVKRGFSVVGEVYWQRTHGGLRLALHHPPTWSSPEKSTTRIFGTSMIACYATIIGAPAAASRTRSCHSNCSLFTQHLSLAQIRMPEMRSPSALDCLAAWADLIADLCVSCSSNPWELQSIFAPN